MPRSTPTIFETHPEIAKQLHPDKNGTVDVTKLTYGSERKVWWVCPVRKDCGCPHEWEAIVSNRCKKGSGCPLCSGRTVCVHDSIVTTHPHIIPQIHPTMNTEIDITRLGAGSHQTLWWKCEKACPHGCEHVWQTKVYDRCKENKPTGCPYCADGSAVLCVHQSIAFTHSDIAAQWHPEKNGDERPEHFRAGSSLSPWWKCPVRQSCGCVHEWTASISNRCRLNSGCPYCSGRTVCPHNSIATTHPSLALQWHPTKNSDLEFGPSTVSAGCNHRVWWKCEKTCEAGCAHEWLAAVVSRTTGSGCPSCSGLTVCVHTSICGTHPHIAAEWHTTKNGKDRPEFCSRGSDKKVWWICNKGHEYEARLANRCRLGSGCSVCRFKTESILLQFLQQKGFSVRPQFTAAWCIDPFTGGRPRFDYEFPDLKIILELDGRQHFQQVRNWKCPIEQTESDVFKMRQANKQGYSVIRLLQEEVWEGREPWLEANLLEVLVTHADIKNIFIATDEHIYDRHIELLEDACVT